jgi:1,4-alpha-glucan branching enzyme
LRQKEKVTGEMLMARKETNKAVKKETKKTVKKEVQKPEENQVFISEADQYVFGQGTHYDIYKKLGAHPSVENGVKGMFFAVWAPHAASVNVIGTFNNWDEDLHVMTKIGPIGIYTLFLPGVGENEMYKYLIRTPEGEKLYKADPFANYAEMRPGNASKTYDITKFKWTDGAWMSSRNGRDYNKEPLAIYECHIGSWMKHPDGTKEGFYNYREFADRIVEYLKEMKYTHIELMGIAEYPYDGSWGYQVTGYYAPTSRYGTPDDFMYLINMLHKNKIGVILDWVPAHFATDAHGLGRFDGQCLFEHPDPRIGEHPDWGTKIFNYGKNEVRNFLIANALFWIKEYHIDGIRVDAVASMLYLDYGKQDGQWVANKYGGNENLEAIEFFKHLNSVVCGTYPGFLTIAEESTAWPKVTGKVEDDGLGFCFKWNMGWMHDFCEYMKLDPYFRKNNHYAMTFAMTYNHSENYILPLSHDEVVHLKCSMLNKMPGYPVDKYANLRLGYTYMFGHSGKKLLFMGQDFGQEREWSEERELDWFLLAEEQNRGMHEYVKELLNMYRKYPALYSIDNDWSGFEWLNADDADRSVYSFFRKDETGRNNIMFVINMTPMMWENYMIGVPKKKKYKLLLNSDDKRFGGNGHEIPAEINAVKGDCNFKKYNISFDLPPYTAAVFVF